MKYVIMASCLTILMAASCKKNKPPKPLTELEKLPPITQTGANTFGCLLNGKAWIPKDNYGQANFKLAVDPNFQDGIFGVTAIRYYAPGKFQSISVGSDSCKNIGVFTFTIKSNNARFTDYGIPLELTNQDSSNTVLGELNISKYDLQNRIFSGTFELTLYNNKTDTVKITNGRFDKKL
ncbi:MAG: hypothetical protein JSS98_12925 [Bacteroidetes bacterium]|nr:hypothetical protein [Bacteroidota bacterium]